MLVSLTVGKVDAGVAVLLTEDKRLIEFPSILLPSAITSGSIVDITVHQNHEAEQKSQAAFASLQKQILNTYGLQTPSSPVLRCRNATQTSIVLEWDPIELATATLRSLALYRNGSKAGNIPRPLDMTSTKISGLAIDTEYSFYLVLRTSSGTYNSEEITIKTHTMNNLTGITVTPGILAPQLRESLESAVKRINAKLVDTVRIDTTHFVCTEGRGRDWERANEMNIPIVRPEWVEGCEREGKLIGVRGYYLDANPKHREVGSNPVISSTSQQQPAPNPPQQHSPGTQAALAATANKDVSETNLPSRVVQSQKPEVTPSSAADNTGAVTASGALGEPGPEIPPSPPSKDEPGSKQEANHDSDDEDDIGTRAKEESSAAEEEDDDDDERSERSNPSQPISSTKKGDGDGGGEMEDVAL